VKHLVAEEREESAHYQQSDAEAQQHESSGSYPPDGGSDDDESDEDVESFDALEERFHALQEEVATLVADVHDLALYTKLNITGFMKILKVRSYLALTNLIFTSLFQKHDVRRSRTLYRFPCCNLTGSAETNQPSPQTHFHPRLSRKATLLQIQLGCAHRKAFKTVQPRTYTRSPRSG
jgi:hypothetical protein